MVYEPCLILNPENVRIAKTARVDSFVKLEGGKGLMIGEHVHIASFSHLNVGGGWCVFEDHSTCSSHCCVGGGSPDWSYLYISAADPPEFHHTVKFTTRICSYAVLFMGVIVVPGATVGEGAIVRPGSLVKEDVPPWSVYEGNPAKKVGVRTIRNQALHPTRA